jgi:NAD(P)-dependent dehydrogenase (short-subunit alcohol dehydrogenase family)
MTSRTAGDRTRVVVVTGGGGGIGAAIAEELGRTGHMVVTVDPLVSLDGSEQLPPAEETTAGRIVAAGGSARASSVSVTDRDAVAALFGELADEFGGLDGVVNVAGITRPTTFATGSEEDWLGVLAVHLDGYRNILEAALPLMAAAGRGRILGVTSGSGWRPADTGAYGCAKRAVAALTWQLGRQVPAGVAVNAMSPIAATRMVTAALERARRASGGGSGPTSSAKSATGGLSLASMPTPDEIGPLGAHLVGDDFDWCSGEIFFAGGSEVAVIDRPRLLEVLRAEDGTSFSTLLDAVAAGALAPAELDQATRGATNPRFGSVPDPTAGSDRGSPSVRTCAIVSDRPELSGALHSALDARSVTCHRIEVTGGDVRFADAAAALRAAAERTGLVDAVVVALSGGDASTDATGGWQQVLAEHRDIAAGIHADAAWTRAAADYATDDHPVRLVTLTDATTSGGFSRAQAAAQLARAGRKATDGRVAAFAVCVESASPDGDGPAAELAAHLVANPDATDLSGAELAAGAGWVGLRSHPRPAGSVILGAPAIPSWLDGVLRDLVGRVQETP